MGQIFAVILLILQLCAAANSSSTTPDPFKHDVKIEDTKKVDSKENVEQVEQDVGSRGLISTPLSTAAESVITFISVFIVGCVITLFVYSWRRFKPDPWR